MIHTALVRSIVVGIVLVGSWLASMPVHADMLQFRATTRIIEPELNYDILLDPSRGLTIADVRRSDLWKPGETPSPNFGYTKNACWFRYDVQFDAAASERDWLLILEFPFLQFIDAWFVMSDGSLVHRSGGTNAERYTSGREDRIRLPHEINFPANELEIRQVYLRVQTDLVMGVHATFQEREYYLANNDRSPSVLWLFVGLSTGLFVYNLFLYIFLWDRAYLMYLFYAALYVVFVPLAVDGYGTILFPQTPWFTDHFLITISALANMSALIFTQEFLQLRKNAPRLHMATYVLHGLWIMLGVAALWVNPQISHQTSNLFALGSIVVIGSGAIMAIRKGYRPAVFFFIGWSILLVLATLFIMQNLGQIPKTFFTEHGFQFGVMAEMVMLSIALAARISAIRREQQEATKKALEGEIYRLKTIELQRERDNADRLLLNILPPVIAARLKQDENPIVDRFPSVAILFADIVGFTKLADSMPPDELVSLLDDVFTRIDDLVTKHGLEKIKTIGDCYMAVSGLPEPRPEYLVGMAEMALDLRDALENLSREQDIDISVRIGVHIGEVVAGVIGRSKFAYDLWGNAVNLASRMESHGVAGRIHVTESFANAMKDHYMFEARGEVAIKGMGPIRTYFLVERKSTHVLSLME